MLKQDDIGVILPVKADGCDQPVIMGDIADSQSTRCDGGEGKCVDGRRVAER